MPLLCEVVLRGHEYYLQVRLRQPHHFILEPSEHALEPGSTLWIGDLGRLEGNVRGYISVAKYGAPRREVAKQLVSPRHAVG